MSLLGFYPFTVYVANVFDPEQCNVLIKVTHYHHRGYFREEGNKEFVIGKIQTEKYTIAGGYRLGFPMLMGDEHLEIELDNPDVWVVDIGDRHEPEKHNFDHHQSLSCPAAFVLVAEYLGLLETMSVMPWWNFKDSVDRFGPGKSSIIYHAGDDLINRNPV